MIFHFNKIFIIFALQFSYEKIKKSLTHYIALCDYFADWTAFVMFKGILLWKKYGKM